MGTVLPLRKFDVADEQGEGSVGDDCFDRWMSSNTGQLRGMERRVTDQVISRWELAPKKFQMLQRLIGSRLWEHCFLLIPDEDFSCSAIVGYGSSAMQALGLAENQFNSIRHVPRYFRVPLTSICSNCLIDHSPHNYNGTAEVPEDDATYKFRMAAMPVTSPIPAFPGSPTRTSYILGVLTYRTVH